jgi:hypothetical protein
LIIAIALIVSMEDTFEKETKMINGAKRSEYYTVTCYSICQPCMDMKQVSQLHATLTI